ncbi:MAG: hypothetical protein MHM6MM_006662 [Cercozoa sp. M6MM]
MVVPMQAALSVEVVAGVLTLALVSSFYLAAIRRSETLMSPEARRQAMRLLYHGQSKRFCDELLSLSKLTLGQWHLFLMAAAGYGHIDTVQYLLSDDVIKRVILDEAAIFTFLKRRLYTIKVPQDLWCAPEETVELKRSRLVRLCNVDDLNTNVLFVAASSGREDCVKFLATVGFSVTLKYQRRRDIARLSRMPASVRCFLQEQRQQRRQLVERAVCRTLATFPEDMCCRISHYLY